MSGLGRKGRSFLPPQEALRPARAPSWLAIALWGSLVATAILTTAVFLAPVDISVTTFGEVPASPVQTGSSAQIILRIESSQEHLPAIHPGLKVRFRVLGNPDRLGPLHQGTVSHVDPPRDTDQTSAHLEPVWRILVTPSDPSFAPQPGRAIQAEIILGQEPFWRLLLRKTVQAKTAAESDESAGSSADSLPQS